MNIEKEIKVKGLIKILKIINIIISVMLKYVGVIIYWY